MANAHSSSSESGGSAWSVINVVLASVFALVTLFLGGSLVVSGIGASRVKHGPKVEPPRVDTAAIPAGAEAAPTAAVVAAPATTAPTSAGATAAAAAPAPADATTTPAASGPEQVLELTPDTVNPMAFAIKSFNVRAGKPVKLTFTNKAPVPLPHNVVVGKAGTKDALMAVAMKLMTDPAGMAKGYVPDTAACPEMLAHTNLLQPGQSESITFICTAAGSYPYMCMFPGHSMMMNGIITAE
ncbi:MAG: rane-bound dehydrogenase domain protein [Verrucomicrobiaceae bacterium]|nr:rane-bound dehydrogenase domain protein [Verrucomicrobiaceae bacterium]